MKNSFYSIILILLLHCPVYASWSDDWTFNGIPLSRFKNTDSKDILEICGGIAFSAFLHWGSHIVFLETKGIKWEQKGIEEQIKEPMKDKDWQMMGRIGFLGQLCGGLIINQTKLKNTFFATGYHSYTFLSIGLYPTFHKDKYDFHLIEKYGGDKDFEFVFYTFSSALLLNSNTN